MVNESFISVPTDVSNEKKLRTFLLRLVERLDEVIGNRGDDGYIAQRQSEEQLQALDDAIGDRLLVINNQITEIDEDVVAIEIRVSDNESDVGQLQFDLVLAEADIGQLQTDVDLAEVDISQAQTDIDQAQTDIGQLQTDFSGVETQLQTIQAQTLVAALNKTLLTGSATYEQAEYDALAQQVKDIADKVDQILTVLTAAEITS